MHVGVWTRTRRLKPCVHFRELCGTTCSKYFSNICLLWLIAHLFLILCICLSVSVPVSLPVSQSLRAPLAQVTSQESTVKPIRRCGESIMQHISVFERVSHNLVNTIEKILTQRLAFFSLHKSTCERDRWKWTVHCKFEISFLLQIPLQRLFKNHYRKFQIEIRT